MPNSKDDLDSPAQKSLTDIFSEKWKKIGNNKPAEQGLKKHF